MKNKGTQNLLTAWTTVPKTPGNSQCMNTTKIQAIPLMKSRLELYCLILDILTIKMKIYIQRFSEKYYCHQYCLPS